MREKKMANIERLSPFDIFLGVPIDIVDAGIKKTKGGKFDLKIIKFVIDSNIYQVNMWSEIGTDYYKYKFRKIFNIEWEQRESILGRIFKVTRANSSDNNYLHVLGRFYTTDESDGVINSKLGLTF